MIIINPVKSYNAVSETYITHMYIYTYKHKYILRHIFTQTWTHTHARISVTTCSSLLHLGGIRLSGGRVAHCGTSGGLHGRGTCARSERARWLCWRPSSKSSGNTMLVTYITNGEGRENSLLQLYSGWTKRPNSDWLTSIQVCPQHVLIEGQSINGVQAICLIFKIPSESYFPNYEYLNSIIASQYITHANTPHHFYYQKGKNN